MILHLVWPIRSLTSKADPRKLLHTLIINIDSFAVPPSTPVIVEKQQGLVYGADVGPFEIGGSLTVTCKVFGGDKNFVKLG